MRAALSGTTRAPFRKETLEKLSAANKGQVPWIKGRKQTPEHRARIDAARQRFFYTAKNIPWPDIVVEE